MPLLMAASLYQKMAVSVGSQCGILFPLHQAETRCSHQCTYRERKNMNLPGVVVDLPTLTNKDKEDLINWGVKNNIDFIAASFVRKEKDLDNIREVLGEEGASIHIISKIENQEGIQNFEEVLNKSDGIMVRLVLAFSCIHSCMCKQGCTT
jgi:pyruvate kinase